ncbi:hypothetical protein BDZ97DRAFT_1923448 [Flammula alnicola]|nr:hypothetical protein BDZ97DRAFT_1923448 [Flammula alnicola]
MLSPPWANAAQLEFLNQRRITFATAQRVKKLQDFWTQTHSDFFALWPDAASEVEESSGTAKAPKSEVDLPHETWVSCRQLNIYNWFNNHALNKGQCTGKVKTVKISIPSSASRISSAIHIYSKRYYETHVKHAVEAEIGDSKIDRKQRIAIINKHLAACFKNESDEVKAEIHEAQEAERAARESSKEADKSIIEAVEALSPDQLLLAQSSLHEVIWDFCKRMGERTGWSFSVLAGGPDPSANGDIATIGIHTGCNTYGHSFRKAFGNYDSAILLTFSSFLHSVYPEPIRRKFASQDTLPATEPGSDGVMMQAEGATTQAEGAETAVLPNVVLSSTATASTVLLKPDFPIAPIIPTPSPTQKMGEETLMMGSDGAMASTSMSVDVNGQISGTATNFHPPADSLTTLAPPVVIPQASTTLNALFPGLKSDCMLQNSTIHNQVTSGWDLPSNLMPASTDSSTYSQNMGGFNINMFGLENNWAMKDMLYSGLDGQWMNNEDIENSFIPFSNSQQVFRQPQATYLSLVLPAIQGSSLQLEPALHLPLPHLATQVCLPQPTVQMSLAQTTIQAPPLQPDTVQAFLPPPTIQTSPSIQAPPLQPDTVQASALPPTIQMSPTIQASPPPLTIQTSPSIQAPPLQLTGQVAHDTVAHDTSRQRQRKPATSREVVPLTDKTISGTKPEWLTNAWDYLKEGVDEVVVWRECLEAWMKFEMEVGLLEGTSVSFLSMLADVILTVVVQHRLGAKSRPAALSKWLQACRYNVIPVIDDVANFAAEWLAWWNLL